jgi:hypothetical protein
MKSLVLIFAIATLVSCSTEQTTLLPPISSPSLIVLVPPSTVPSALPPTLVTPPATAKLEGPPPTNQTGETVYDFKDYFIRAVGKIVNGHSTLPVHNPEGRSDVEAWMTFNWETPFHFEFYNISKDTVYLRYELVGKMLRRFEAASPLSNANDIQSLGMVWMPRFLKDGQMVTTSATKADRFSRNLLSGVFEYDAANSTSGSSASTYTDIRHIDSIKFKPDSNGDAPVLADCLDILQEWQDAGVVKERNIYCKGYGHTFWTYFVKDGYLRDSSSPEYALRKTINIGNVQKTFYLCHSQRYVELIPGVGGSTVSAKSYLQSDLEKSPPDLSKGLDATIETFQNHHRGDAPTQYVNCYPNAETNQALTVTAGTWEPSVAYRVLANQGTFLPTLPFQHTVEPYQNFQTIAALYVKYYGRGPSPEEVYPQAIRLEQRKAKLADIEKEVSAGADAAKHLFSKVYGRAPVDWEIQNYIDKIGGDFSYLALQSSLSASDEGIHRLCLKYLNRHCKSDSAQAELSTYRARIQNNPTPEAALNTYNAISEEISNSDEALGFIWKTYLCRSITAAEITNLRKLNLGLNQILFEVKSHPETLACAYSRYFGVNLSQSASDWYRERIRSGEMTYEDVSWVFRENTDSVKYRLLKAGKPAPTDTVLYWANALRGGWKSESDFAAALK